MYLVEGVLDMGSLATSYYCKDQLQLGPSGASALQTVAQVPLGLTPLLGILTDTGPTLLGYRRKAYLVLVGLLGASTSQHSTARLPARVCQDDSVYPTASNACHMQRLWRSLPVSAAGFLCWGLLAVLPAHSVALAALLLAGATAALASSQVIADSVLVGMCQGHEQVGTQQQSGATQTSVLGKPAPRGRTL